MLNSGFAHLLLVIYGERVGIQWSLPVGALFLGNNLSTVLVRRLIFLLFRWRPLKYIDYLSPALVPAPTTECPAERGTRLQLKCCIATDLRHELSTANRVNARLRAVERDYISCCTATDDGRCSAVPSSVLKKNCIFFLILCFHAS